jgi:hypothetical protein
MSRRIVAVLALLIGVFGAWECAKAPKEVVITNHRASPWRLHVVRGVHGDGADRVVWRNNDDISHTVSLNSTPFVAGDLRITVPAHGSSTVFTVSQTIPIGEYLYQVFSDPDSAAADSGPGPIVIVDE